MTIDFKTRIQAGGGRFAALYYIAGMPWAVCTDPDLITAVDTAYRRKLFGNATVDAGSTYLADKIQIVPGLSHDFGSQGIRYSEDGGLQQDSWSVAFARDVYPLSFAEYYSDGRQGFLGLDITPDTDNAGVYQATLSSSWPKSAGGFTFIASMDDQFEDWFDAKILAGETPFVWLGNQALACLSRSGNEVLAINCWYTQKSYIPRGTEYSERVRVTSVPLDGCVGFNSYLYLIELTADGELAEPDLMPIIYRSGRVQQNSLSNSGLWSITNTSWISLLEQTMPQSTFKATLKGYMLTRPPANTAATFAAALSTKYAGPAHPHLVLYEDTGNTYTATAEFGIRWYPPTRSDIWLCAAGSYVYYPTLDDLRQAVADEIYEIQAGTSTLNPGVTLEFEYYLSDIGLVYKPGTTPADLGFVIAGGRLPFILGWKWIPQKYLDDLQSQPKWYSYLPTLARLSYYPYVCLPNEWSAEGLPYNADLPREQPAWGWYSGEWDGTRPAYLAGDTDEFPGMFVEFGGPCEYWYDWALDNTTVADGISSGAGTIPIANNRIYVESEDLSEVQEDVVISIGNPRRFVAEDSHDPWIAYSPALLTAFSTTANLDYIQLKPASTYIDPGASTVAKWRTGKIRNGVTRPIEVGQALYRHPDFHEEDIWPVHIYQEIRSETVSEVFKTLLGAGVTSISEQFRLSNIPDTVGYSSVLYRDNINRTLIDWDTLDALTAGTIPGAEYKYTIGSASGETDSASGQTLLKQLNSTLMTHKIQPAWEYSEAQRAWWITFTEVGVDNATTATYSGRSYTAADFALGASMPTTIGDSWVVSEIRYESELRGDVELVNGFSVGYKTGQLKLSLRSPYKLQTKGTASLAVDDRIISPSFDSRSKIVQNLGSVLARLGRVYNTQQCTCVPSALTKIAVGREILLTGTQVLDHNTGQYGASEIVGKIVSADMDLERPTITIRVNNRPLRAISPSLYIDASQITQGPMGSPVLAVAGLNTDPTLNDFAPTNTGMTDLAFFDCLYWDVTTNSIQSVDCDCADYRVILLRRNQSDMAELSEYWTATISNVNVAAGSCTITLDSATGFTESGEFVLFFAPYSDADLQPHQKIWAWFGNASGRVTDADGVTKIGAVIG